MIYIPQCHTRTCQTEVRELPARYGYGAALRVVSCQVKHFILGSVARSTEFSVYLPNSHKIYRSTDLNLKSTEKLLKKIFII
jgi:hypothetical protein